MKSVVVAAATLLLLSLVFDRPGGAVFALSTGVGRATGGTPSPADRDRSILLQWRKASPQLQTLWNDTNAPVGAWEGVTVGKKGRVVTIEFRYKDLSSGGVPAVFGGLTALEILNLTNNQLHILPAEIGSLTALQVLDLSSNELV